MEGVEDSTAWYGHGEFSYDAAKNELVFSRTSRTVMTDEEEPLPLGSPQKIPIPFWAESEAYVLDITTREVYRYEVLDGILRYVDGTQYVDFGSMTHDINEVAKYFQLGAGQLRKMNSLPDDTTQCTGAIVIEEHLGEYHRQTYDEAQDLTDDN
jgi:hypothetical protein